MGTLDRGGTAVSFLGELRRRNVIRVGLAYVIAGWLLVQVLEVAADIFEAPSWAMKFSVTLIAVGLVPVLIFSWIYEITPEGIRREAEVEPDASITHHTGRKLNVALIVLVGLALATFVAERAFFYGSAGSRTGEDSAVATQTDGEAPMAREASVAVLPFTTRSRNEDDQFFSDGVHDDLLTQLSKIGELKVISRTSVMEYRDTTKRIPDIARELGVSTVVEGAVQRAGDMVRITAQLIDARTDEHLWAESYDRALTANNLLAIQTEIATSIAGALQATLSPEEKAELGRRLTDDLQALEAYQRAGWLMRDDHERALRELEFALERDPAFAAAWARLAQAHMEFYWRGTDPTEARRRMARSALDRGRAIDPGLPALDVAEGFYYYWGFYDYEAALAVLEPALSAYPNASELHETIGYVNRRFGRFDEAVRHMEAALELDPRNVILPFSLGSTYIDFGEYARAQGYLERLREMDPDGWLTARLAANLAVARDGDSATAAAFLRRASDRTPYAGIFESFAYMGARDYGAALEAIARIDVADLGDDGAMVFGPYAWTPDLGTGMVRHLAGDVEAARPLLQRALETVRGIAAGSANPGLTLASQCLVLGTLERIEEMDAVCGQALKAMTVDAFLYPEVQMEVACGFAMAGRADRAFELLRESVASRPGPSRNELLLRPELDALRDDPRWSALLAGAKP